MALLAGRCAVVATLKPLLEFFAGADQIAGRSAGPVDRSAYLGCRSFRIVGVIGVRGGNADRPAPPSLRGQQGRWRS